MRPDLSPRKIQVANLILRALTDREIGAALGIGARTVRFHVELLRSRFGGRNRVELALNLFRLKTERPEMFAPSPPPVEPAGNGVAA